RLPRAARRRAAAHRPAVEDRGASDRRRARRGAEPGLAAHAGAQQSEAVRPRPAGLRLLRLRIRPRGPDARAHRAALARRQEHLGKIMKVVLGLLVAASLTACATPPGPGVVHPYEAQRMSYIHDATILSVRPVTIDGYQTGAGAGIGAIAGGVAAANAASYHN